MTFDGTKEELAEMGKARRLDVEKLGFAVRLIVNDHPEIDAMVNRINSWIDQACEALRGVDTCRAKREAA